MSGSWRRGGVFAIWLAAFAGSAHAQLHGDANGDGTVNGLDNRAWYLLWVQHVTNGTFNVVADANADGAVNFFDLGAYRGMASAGEGGAAFPTNDFCGTVQGYAHAPIQIGTTPIVASTRMSMFDAEYTGGSAPAGHANSNDLWYAVTATGTGTITVSTCGSSIDTVLDVRSSAACPLSVSSSGIASNDNATAGPCAGSAQSYLTFTPTNGTTYYIRVGGKNDARGVLQLAVTGPVVEPPPPPPPPPTYPEIEPNDAKAEATVIPSFSPGQTLGGDTTSSTGAGVDTFLISTPPAAPAIYRHRLLLTGATTHTLSLRGLTQTAGIIAQGTDATAQISTASTTPSRFEQWYGFGRRERMYIQVTGSATTTTPYRVTIETTPIIPFELGQFNRGQVTISTAGQGHSTDTDLQIFNADFHPIAGFSNDDNSVAGGGTGTGGTSTLRREYGPGVYYLAISNSSLIVDQPPPADDRSQNGVGMDFDGPVVNSSTTAGSLPLQFSISAPGRILQGVGANKTEPYLIHWYRFVVVNECPADYNRSGAGSVQDIFDFLAAYFSGCP